MKLFVFLHNQLASAVVRKTDADACIFHRTGKTDGLTCFDGRVKLGLYRLERLDKTGLRADDLTVRQDAARANRVAVADFPRADADFLRHFVEQTLDGKAGLRHAEAAERACGRIVRIKCPTPDFKVFVGIGTCRMRAGALKNRTAERCKRARIGHDLRLHALNNAVFVAADCKVHPERVALRVDQQRLFS